MNAPAASSPRFVRTRAGLAAVAVALFAVLVPTAPAAAHDQLVSSDPAAEAVLTELPTEITLTYSAELLGDAESNLVEVTDAAGTALNDGPAVVDGVTVSQALTGAASGPVTVLWRVVSSDGHPISGEFAFTVEGAATAEPSSEPAEPSASATPEPTMTTTTESESETPAPAPEPAASDSSPLLWVVGAAIVLGVIGAVVYLLVIRPRRGGGAGSAGTGAGADD